MGTDARCTRIGCANHPEKWMRVELRRIGLGKVTEASQRQAGYDTAILVGESGVCKALLGCPENLRECLVEAKPDVARTGNPLAKHAAARVRQAGTAFRATAIDPKKNYIRLHAIPRLAG
jgi:hypothetical protein